MLNPNDYLSDLANSKQPLAGVGVPAIQWPSFSFDNNIAPFNLLRPSCSFPIFPNIPTSVDNPHMGTFPVLVPDMTTMPISGPPIHTYPVAGPTMTIYPVNEAAAHEPRGHLPIPTDSTKL